MFPSQEEKEEEGTEEEDSSSELMAYDLEDNEEDLRSFSPKYLKECLEGIRSEKADEILISLQSIPSLTQQSTGITLFLPAFLFFLQIR